MKRKLKIKKLNLIIIILSLILCSILIINTVSLFQNKQSPEEIELNKKLKKLNNIDKKIKYFNYNKIDRYIAYKNKNKTLSNKKVITHVNIGIDQPPYKNSIETTYLNKIYILVNKYNHLSEQYIPKDLELVSNEHSTGNVQLVKEAKNQFEIMSSSAKKENLNVIAFSGYRDYTYQKNLYNTYLQKDSQEKVDTYSARAGYSEHQTGLSVDIYNGIYDYNNFEQTKEFKWLKDNAHKYGFILRYPKNKELETQYQYESWHYRYVGIDSATYIKKHNISFDEYYVQNIEK